MMTNNKNLNYDTGEYLRFCSPQNIERDFNNLIGMLNGIRSDDVVNTKEITNIADWLTKTKIYENREPYIGLIQRVSLALEDYHLTVEEIDDIIWYCQKCISDIHYYSSETSSIQQLYGILDGIISDGVINEQEFEYLSEWLIQNQNLEGKYPYDNICQTIAKSLVNKSIHQDELKELKIFCNAFKVNNSDFVSENNRVIDYLRKNIFDEIHGQVVFEGTKICITGGASGYNRSELVSKLLELGANCTNTVSSRTDYLIVCDKRSHAWTYSMYGRKIEQAIHLKLQDAKIKILHVEDVYKYL